MLVSIIKTSVHKFIIFITIVIIEKFTFIQKIIFILVDFISNKENSLSKENFINLLKGAQMELNIGNIA